MYKVSITFQDKTFKAEGETLIEAFNNLKFETPKLVKGFANLIAEKEGKKIEKRLNTPTLKRFAVNPVTRSTWAKLMVLGL